MLDNVLKAVEGLKDEIKKNIPKASGKTARAIKIEKVEEGNKTIYKIVAPKYVKTLLPPGRKPTTNAKGGEFTVDKIRQWIIDKGISVDDLNSASWAIYKKINKEGTRVPNRFNKGQWLDKSTQGIEEKISEAIKEDTVQYILNTIKK